MSALRELLATFDVEVKDEALNKFEGRLDSIGSALKSAGALFAGAFAFKEAKAFIDDTAKMAAGIGGMSTRLGLGAEALQKFQFASKLDMGEAAQTLGIFNRTLGNAATGNKEAGDTFKDLHVNIRDNAGNLRTTDAVLLDVVSGVSQLGSQAEKTAAVMKVFGRGGGELLGFINKGPEGIRELYKEFDTLGVVIDDSFIKQSKEARAVTHKLEFVFRALRVQLVSAVLPAVTKMSQKYLEFAAAGLKVIKTSNLIQTGLAILGTAGAVKLLMLVGPLLKILGLTTSAKGGILGMVSNLLRLGLPLLLVGALVLVLEDLYTMVTGGKSVIGDWLDQFGGAGEKEKLIKDLKGAFGQLRDAVTGMGPVLADFGKSLISAFVEAMPIIVGVVKVVGSLVSLLSGAVGGLAKVAQGDWSGAGKEIDKAGDRVFGKGGFFDMQTQNVGPGMGESGFAGNKLTHEQLLAAQAATLKGGAPGAAVPSIPATQAAGSGGKVTTVTQQNKVDIHIDGSKDPKKTADAVNDALGSAFDKQKRDAANAVGAH